MKKSKIILFFVLALLTSCNRNRFDISSMNDKFDKNANVTLSIQMSKDNEELIGNYSSTKGENGYLVNYQFETLKRIYENSAIDDRKKLNSGSYTFSDNQIINQNGDNCNLAFNVISLYDYVFDANDYSNIENKEGLVIARINDFSKLFSIEGNYGETFINVYYSEIIQKIIVETNKDDYKLKMIYNFS